MNSPFFIARRYLFSRKSHNVINWISAISVFGIMVSTAALVIVLSSFSGIEGLISSLYSDYYQDIKIESKNSKTFDRNLLPEEITEIEGLANYSEVIQDIVMIKYYNNSIFTTLVGVENSFLDMSNMETHMDDGIPLLEDNYGPLALIGTDAMMSLDAYIYTPTGSNEQITIFAPNREKKLKSNSMAMADAFTTARIDLIGNFRFGTDETDNLVLVPIDYAADILHYGSDISSVQMHFNEDVDLENKKEELQNILGDSFTVKTSFEQNELIYKTSKSEKWYTAMLLAFIFFLATFNMIASITMIVIEKKDNLKTLWALGAKRSQLERIFFFEGLLITGIGTILGLIVGYFICYLQQTFGLIRMEEGIVDYYPVVFKLDDLLLILSITIFFGTLAAFVPGKVLIKRIIK